MKIICKIRVNFNENLVGSLLFVIILYILPLLAWLAPSFGAYGGTLRLEYFNNFFVATIFFINGLNFTNRAFSKIKINSIIFVLCFFALPLIAYFFPKMGIRPEFSMGIIIFSCLPITAASCVSLTQMSGGDRYVPLLSAVATNLIGAILTPLLLTFFLDLEALHLNPFKVMGSFSYLIVVPLLVGKIFSYYFPKLCTFPLQKVSEILLLFIVYAAFCTTFFQIQQLKIPFAEIAVLVALVLVLHLVYIFLAVGVSRALQFAREDRVAMVFTVPQKTIVAGIPLILAVIATTPTLAPEDFAFLTLPLLIYNNIQWLIAGVLLLYFRRIE